MGTSYAKTQSFLQRFQTLPWRACTRSSSCTESLSIAALNDSALGPRERAAPSARRVVGAAALVPVIDASKGATCLYP